MNYYPPRSSTGIDTRPLPVLLADFKDQMRIDGDGQDRLLMQKIAAATIEIEHYLQRPIIAGGYVLILPRFPSVALDGSTSIKIPNSPARSIEAVKYIDENDVLQTIDSAAYDLVSAGTYHTIAPATDMSWPTTQTVDDAVSVEYTAGLALTPEEVPADLREAVMLRAGTRLAVTEEVGMSPRQPWSIAADIAVVSMIRPYCLMSA